MIYKQNPLKLPIFLLLGLALAVIFSTFSYALSSANLNQVYHLDANATDVIYGRNGTTSGVIYDNGLLNKAITFNNSGSINFTPAWDNAFNANNGTIELWFRRNASSGVSEQYIYYGQATGTQRFYLFFSSTDNKLKVGIGSVNMQVIGNNAPTFGKWYHFALVFNSSDIYAYLNGTRVNSSLSRGGWDNTKWSDQNMFLGMDSGSQIYKYIGSIDELRVWNRTLSDSEIQESYNSGNGNAYPFTSSISWITPTPPDNDRFNPIQNTSTLYLNASCTGTGNLYNIYFGNVLTALPKVVSITADVYANWTINTTSDGTYYYTANCNSGFNATVRTLVFASIAPSLVLNPSNVVDMNNQSTTQDFSAQQNLTINISAILPTSDLFAFLFNISHPNGTVMFSYDNESLIDSHLRNYNYTVTLNYSTWQRGINYTLTAQASDSHTLEKISNYGIEYAEIIPAVIGKDNKIIVPPQIDMKQQNQLTGDNPVEIDFSTTENNDIQITTDLPAIGKATKQYDRYTFDFDFGDTLETAKTFHIISDKPITYVSDNYIAHFVVWNPETKSGNWIDFNNPAYGIPDIEQVSENEYTITFYTSENILHFESIGGLNIGTYTGRLFLPFYPNVTTPSITTNTGKNFLVNQLDLYGNGIINCPYSNCTISYCYYLNGVPYLCSNENLLTSFYTGNISYIPSAQLAFGQNWSFGYAVKDNVYSNSSALQWINSTNSTVYTYYLDNCSNILNIPSNATALNITFLDENTLTLLNANIVGTINLGSQNLTFSKTNINNLSLCVYPSWLNTSVNAYFQYNVSEPERYYLQNVYLNNQTQLLNLYNFNSGEASSLTEVNAIANNYAYSIYPGIIGNLQRYYPATNSWITVQNDKSDNFGNLIYYINQNSVDYQILWTLNNQLLDQTQPLKFICNSVPCQQTFIINNNAPTTGLENFNFTHNYNNNTGIYTLTWFNPTNTVSDVRLVATMQAANGIIHICDTTVASSSGSISCNLSGYSGLIDIQAYGNDPTPFWNDKINAAVQLLSSVLKNKGMTNDSYFLSFIFALGVIGLFMANPVAAIIGLIGSFILLSFLGMLSILTFGIIISIACMGGLIIFMIKRY